LRDMKDERARRPALDDQIVVRATAEDKRRVRDAKARPVRALEHVTGRARARFGRRGLELDRDLEPGYAQHVAVREPLRPRHRLAAQLDGRAPERHDLRAFAGEPHQRVPPARARILHDDVAAALATDDEAARADPPRWPTRDDQEAPEPRRQHLPELSV